MTKPIVPSIFNDVIGPIMRGPSSSHTAASWRIAKTAIQLLNEPLEKVLIEFVKKGIWASNYREQGTTLGMEGGLLGIDITDERILNTETIARDENISIEYRISSFPADHTNTVRLTLTGRSGNSIEVIAVSTGGGMFEIQKYNGIPVDIQGDRYIMLIRVNNADNKSIPEALEDMQKRRNITGWSIKTKSDLIQVSSSNSFPENSWNRLTQLHGVDDIVFADPVLPIIARNEINILFSDPESMLSYVGSKNLSLGKLGLIYECNRSGLKEAELLVRMKKLIGIIENGITKGLEGTNYKDRILHQQARLIVEASKAGKIKTDPLINKTIAYITALMEVKSAMEVIVALPTAGSCGTFGGTIKAFCEINNLDDEQKTLAYFAGGMIGVFFAQEAGFSAEEHGCQVETGAAGCMAAAALADLSGGSAQQSLDAASLALQNSIGLICDPVADRVEVPCLGKNVTAGMNALSASSMAIAGFDPVIPLKEVVFTVGKVGRMLPPALCNSGKGGLANTATARMLKERLKGF